MVVAPRTEATTAQFQGVINTVFEIIAPVGVAVYSTETFISRCSYGFECHHGQLHCQISDFLFGALT